MFLNNRYMDPNTGIFISVDPLVGKTGQPYLYAGGNPATLSDPTGLCTGWLCNAQDNKAAKADWLRHVAEFEASGFEKAARESRVSEPNAAGFFIARVLDPFHDAVGIDIAMRSGGSFEIGCGLASGQPDLCHPGTSPMIIGELKYDSPFGAKTGPPQLRRYLNDPLAAKVVAGAFGSSGNTMVGVLRFDWREDSGNPGLYFYKLNNWDLGALLAGMAAALGSNRNLQAGNRAALVTTSGAGSSGAGASEGANDWEPQPPPDWLAPALFALAGAAAGAGGSGGGGVGFAWHAL
ncbi:MAG: RHS repeat-associated core domain-containing protein [Ilumatobacteraceae bacterium]